MKTKLISVRKGKTYEEIFGIKKAKEIKIKKSKTFIERFGEERTKELKLKIGKGKNYEEFYGEERAKKILKKMSKNRTKWTKENIITSIKKIFEKEGELTKTQIDHKKDICNIVLIKKRFGSLDELAKQANIKFKSTRTRIGINETKFLDEIEVINNIKLERQHPVYINNSYKFIDGYDSVNKVEYEVDEPYHKR